MADKKFGTFGGVFTPSILTILGVIMYLRLPWIVGQAGLYATLGIILVAHVISVLTGLSISSIATDKKVKAGGNYFIISRSLGLPIGGTLGIALFVGLSFSVSLYVIGFSESFLGFWGIAITKNAIRVAGTIALIGVTTIIFISTSLAIKTQYIIMTAIGLSLISVLFGNASLAPAKPLFTPIAGAAPLMVLFGIFFPAVTGFEAGVSMSGDLKDPKKSIPVGTISAIALGLLVYVGLAVFLAFRVNSDALVNNSNVLLDISFFSPLVIAGIWGATISSAMGSILGAPRILQATSYDRITPKIFSKGYGKTNEPRNALVLTFFLAEAGILIGELNMIARIVSIFFITTYGFLNMSCAIENWASPDFRPSFRIPAWSSILGSIACFFVMLELDVLALIGASVILGGIFLFLKNRELTLESGDTWEGVWSSIIRSGLFRLSRVVRHQRNWRPNIILFSGESSIRPQLLEFGKWLVYRRGILSNFDLRETPHTEKLTPKTGSAVIETDEESEGVFSRQMECSNIYDGMDTISRVYGFSGLDPNTILMGWSQNGRDPQHFTRVISNMIKLNFNILVLNYDRERGFGERKQIDIWWRGGSNNATLALVVLKFLTASDEWREATARIMIISDNSALNNKINKNLTRILEDQRIDARVKIINNAIDKRPFPEIIRIESAEADLIMLGIPDFNESNAARYLQNTRLLVNDLNSMLFLNASSSFTALPIGIEIEIEEGTAAEEKMPELPPLKLPSQEALAANLELLDERIQHAFDEFEEAYLNTIETLNHDLIKSVEGLLERNLDFLAKSAGGLDAPRFRRLLSRVQTDIFFQSRRILSEFEIEEVALQKDNLETGLESIFAQLKAIKPEAPSEITLFFDPEEFEKKKSDSLRLKTIKLRERLRRRWLKKPVRVRLNFNAFITFLVEDKIPSDLLAFLNKFGLSGYELISDVQKLLNSFRDVLNAMELESHNRPSNEIEAGAILEKMSEKFDETFSRYAKKLQSHLEELKSGYRAELQDLADHSRSPEINSYLRKKYSKEKAVARTMEKIAEIPPEWQKNQGFIINFALVDLNLMVFQNRLNIILNKLKTDLVLGIENNILDVFSELQKELNRIVANEPDVSTGIKLSAKQAGEFTPGSLMKELNADIQAALKDLPETIEVISELAFEEIEIRQYEQIEIDTLSLRRLVTYLIETELSIPLQEEFRQVNQRIEYGMSQAGDAVRLVNFTLSTQTDPETAEIYETEKSLQTTVRNAIQRLEKEFRSVEEISEKSLAFIDQKKTEAFDKMNPYLLIRTAQNLGQFIRTRKSRKILTQMGGIREQITTSAKKVLVSGVYRQSRGMLMARRFSQVEAPHRNRVDRLLDLAGSVSPRPEILKSLPLYYRQLFLSRQQITPEFWVDRRLEMKKAEEIVDRYRSGYFGSLLISGRPNSGKTVLSQFIARRFFDRTKVFQVSPPDGGSADPEMLQRAVQEATQTGGDLADIFRSLPVNSVCVIHDLELWWQRSPDGLAAIAQIGDLLNDFSERCFFIVNVNFYSYKLIRKISSLDDYFLGTIFCEPFSSDELRQAVMLRHASTGLSLSLKEASNPSPSNYRLARYFSKLAEYSDGNIGAAFNGWISHAKDYSENTIVLREPRRPDLTILEEIDDDWLLWLVQFVLHKQFTPKKLGAVFKMEADQVERQLKTLRRSGLITVRSENVFEINQFVKSFLVERLVKMELI